MGEFSDKGTKTHKNANLQAEEQEEPKPEEKKPEESQLVAEENKEEPVK
jgi:hypothetical protein